jgi:hypothetical protein
MQLFMNPVINDGYSPDFKIYWKIPNSSKIGKCTIFTYGKRKEIAIAAFHALYHGYEILKVEELHLTIR